MKKLLDAIVGSAAGFFLHVPISTAVGAAAAHLIGLVAGDVVYQTLAAFNLIQTPVEPWQIGATLGFLSSFIRSTKV